MQITRIEGNVGRSIVAGGKKVNELPPLLQMQMKDILSKMKGVKYINVEEESQGAIFELSNRNVTLDFFDEKLREEIMKTIDLLQWYQGHHWNGASDVCGGPIYCAHCSNIRPFNFFGSYCPNSQCPSHKKWSQIIGPSYKSPTPREVSFDKIIEKDKQE